MLFYTYRPNEGFIVLNLKWSWKHFGYIAISPTSYLSDENQNLIVSFHKELLVELLLNSGYKPISDLETIELTFDDGKVVKVSEKIK